MKKILLAAVAVLAIMVSCQKENVNAPLTLEEQLGFEIKSTFEATIVNDAADVNAPKDGKGTMAHLDGENYVCWNDTDKISINGITHQTTIASLDETNMTVNFYGSVVVPLGTDNKYHAFFPAGIQSTTEYNKGTLPAYQTFSYDGAISLPMYAVATAPSHALAFHNLCSILEITIPAGIEANKIEITADECLAGSFEIDANGVLNMTETADSYKKLTINAGSTAWHSGDIIKCAIPGRTQDANNDNATTNFYHNMTISIYKTDGTKIVRSKAQFKVKPSQIYKMKINCTKDAANAFVKAGSNVAAFSVSATQQVYFTAGNLWYDRASQTHAPHLELNQFECPNHRHDGHVGHFYYGATADDASVTNTTSPTTVKSTQNLFCASNYTVDGISGLRTLSETEWEYLILNHKIGYAYISGIDGNDNVVRYLIIAPDGYSTDIASSYSYSDVESNGFLCLPLSGLVSNNKTALTLYKDSNLEKRYGRYWSSNSGRDLNFGQFSDIWLAVPNQTISDGTTIHVSSDDLASARCIRLVKDVNAQ